MLKLRDLRAGYGGTLALVDVTLDVKRGECVAVVGPNGAGKTTMFKTISGVIPTRGGSILFEGVDLASLAPAERARRGIAHIPEGRRVFASLTVEENIELGLAGLGERAARRPMRDRLFEIFPVLFERRRQLAGTLSGGEQQMLAIARGLASRPRLVLLDEPSMGLSPKIAAMIFDRIGTIRREEKTTIVLVEQRVAEALDGCDRGYVLRSGRVVLEGNRDLLMQGEVLKRAYLGL